MSNASGLTAIALIAPFASLPILIYWVCIVLTRSSATLPIVLNSVLNNLPKDLVAPPAYLKYSRVENLFRSKESVKASVELLMLVMLASNFPVALILLIRLLFKLA